MMCVWTVLFVPKFSATGAWPALSWFKPRRLDLVQVGDLFPVQTVDPTSAGAWFEGAPDTHELARSGRSDLGVKVGHLLYALDLPDPLLKEFVTYLESVAQTTPSRWVGVCHWTGSTPVAYRKSPISSRQALMAMAADRTGGIEEDVLYRFAPALLANTS